MSIWVLEWRSNDDCNATLWSSQHNAFMQACSEIQDDICNNWDLQDSELHEIAKSITDHICCGDFVSAIDEYNAYQDSESYPNWYSVYPRDISPSPNFSPIVLGTFQSDEDEEEEDIPITLPGTAMQNPGATCRGSCGAYNEYAYPDNPNGTYCCYSCKQSGST